jgi:hypothetical protein
MIKRKQVDELESIIGKLRSIHSEVSNLSNKKPNDGVNGFKIKMINTVVACANTFIGDDVKPFRDFYTFDLDDLPTNSDVAFVIGQYLECFEKFRADNIKPVGVLWVYALSDSDDKIFTSKPAKLKI